MDPNRAPQYDEPLWSETRWVGCWSPDEGVGLFLHVGRLRGDIDNWYAQTVAYLPDGELAVDRQWGRASDEHGLETGNLSLRPIDPRERFSCRFDGVGELTTTEALAAGPRGAAAPSAPMRWELEAEAAAPLWDMYGGQDEGTEGWAGASHTQQLYHCSGSLNVGDASYRLDGPCYCDHSSGKRAWDDFGSHHFVLGAMPGFAFHQMTIADPAGKQQLSTGALFRDGAQHDLASTELAPLESLLGAPREPELVLTTESGETVPLRCEILAVLPMTITEANDNINGCDWEASGDPILFAECAARFTAPDGAVGYGHFERSARRSRVNRETFAVAAA